MLYEESPLGILAHRNCEWFHGTWILCVSEVMNDTRRSLIIWEYDDWFLGLTQKKKNNKLNVIPCSTSLLVLLHKSTSIILAWVELEVELHVCVWFKWSLNVLYLKAFFWIPFSCKILSSGWWPCGGLWALLFGDPERFKITSFVFTIFHPLISYPIFFKCNSFWTALVSLTTPYCPVSEDIICTRAARRLQLLKKKHVQIVSVNIASNISMSETKTTISFPFVG